MGAYSLFNAHDSMDINHRTAKLVRVFLLFLLFYKQLKSKYSGKTRILSGIVGAKHIGGDKYELLVE